MLILSHTLQSFRTGTSVFLPQRKKTRRVEGKGKKNSLKNTVHDDPFVLNAVVSGLIERLTGLNLGTENCSTQKIHSYYKVTKICTIIFILFFFFTQLSSSVNSSTAVEDSSTCHAREKIHKL